MQNSLADVLPQNPFTPTQLSNYESLYINVNYSPLTIQRVILNYLYTNHGIIQTAVEQPVQDAFRGGLEIHSGELSLDDIKTLDDYLERNSVINSIMQMGIWMRLFGGAGLIINTEQETSEPLNENKLGNFELYAADRWELSAANRVSEHYNFYGQDIHSSRVITVSGREAPSVIRPQLAGWGMSEVEHMVRDLNAYFKNKDMIFELLDEAKIDVYKIEGFNNALATTDGTTLIKKRIEMANQLKNYLTAVVMDKNDDYDQKQLSFGGLAEMSKENMIGIASALKIPMTKLFGLSAAGFNSGEDDIENYNCLVESNVRTPLRPVIRRVLELICVKLFGYKPDIDFKYKSLRIIGATDEETVKASKHTRILNLYDRGLITVEETAQMLKKEGLLPIETQAEQGLKEMPLPPTQISVSDKLP